MLLVLVFSSKQFVHWLNLLQNQDLKQKQIYVEQNFDS